MLLSLFVKVDLQPFATLCDQVIPGLPQLSAAILVEKS
jgi:hypothetical protein